MFLLSGFVTNRQWERILVEKESFGRKTRSLVKETFHPGEGLQVYIIKVCRKKAENIKNTIFGRSVCYPERNFYICEALFRIRIREGGLKGNRVKIPDRPAAVSFIHVPGNTRATVEKREGVRLQK